MGMLHGHFIKRKMGQKVFGLSMLACTGLRIGCPKISAGMLIWSHLGALPGQDFFVILF